MYYYGAVWSSGARADKQQQDPQGEKPPPRDRTQRREGCLLQHTRTKAARAAIASNGPVRKAPGRRAVKAGAPEYSIHWNGMG